MAFVDFDPDPVPVSMRINQTVGRQSVLPAAESFHGSDLAPPLRILLEVEDARTHLIEGGDVGHLSREPYTALHTLGKGSRGRNHDQGSG